MSILAPWIRGIFKSFSRESVVTGDLLAYMDAIHDQFLVIKDPVCFKETIFSVMNFVPRTKEEKTY